MNTKNKISFYCFLAGMCLVSSVLWSCSDDDNEDGRTDSASFGTAAVGEVSFCFNYAYSSSVNTENGIEYTIYLSSHNMFDLTGKPTADPDVYLNDANITLLLKDGNQPSGTYSYPDGGLIAFDLGGYYWANAWGDQNVETGPKESYYYEITDSDTPSTIEVTVKDNNLHIKSIDIAVAGDEGTEAGAQRAVISYDGKIQSFSE